MTERAEALPEGARVLLVTGIARPGRFERSVEGLDAEVADCLRFADHHDYRGNDLERIQRLAESSRAEWVLTTTKDYVKLLGRLETPLAHLPIRAEPEERFWTWLDDALERHA